MSVKTKSHTSCRSADDPPEPRMEVWAPGTCGQLGHSKELALVRTNYHLGEFNSALNQSQKTKMMHEKDFSTVPH